MAARSVSGIAIGAMGLFLLGACGWGITTEKYSDDSVVDQEITSVQFATDSGNMTIRTGKRTTVHREVHYNEDRPGKTHRVDGDTLVISACGQPACRINYDIVVPAGTEVTGKTSSGQVTLSGVATANVQASSGDVRMDEVDGQATVEANSGDISLSGVAGDVVAKANSGDVTARDVAGTVTTRVESGDVAANGVTGAVDVRSSSGNVTVRLNSAQDVTTHASSGDVTVTVPPGDYEVTTDTGSGDVHNELEDSTGGNTHRLDLETGSGDISITHP